MNAYVLAGAVALSLATTGCESKKEEAPKAETQGALEGTSNDDKSGPADDEGSEQDDEGFEDDTDLEEEDPPEDEGDEVE